MPNVEKGLGRDELARVLAGNDPDPCDPIEYDAAAYYRAFAGALLATGYRVIPPGETDGTRGLDPESRHR